MAKTKPANETEKKAAPKKSFEERLERLEELGDEIRKTDIPLDDAIKAYEEGIKLVQALERDLKKIESRIEILRNDTTDYDEVDDDNGIGRADEGPVLGLFDDEE